MAPLPWLLSAACCLLCAALDFSDFGLCCLLPFAVWASLLLGFAACCLALPSPRRPADLCSPFDARVAAGLTPCGSQCPAPACESPTAVISHCA